MAILHLFDNTVGPPTYSSTGSAFERGVRFVSAAGCTVTALRWFAGDTTASHHPSHVTLWKQAGTENLATHTITDAEHPGAVGWVTITLPTPVVLNPNETYILAEGVPAFVAWARISNPPQPPYPFLWAAGANGVQGTIDTMPTTQDGTNTYAWVDAIFDTDYNTTPDNQPPLVGDVRATFTAWFDPGSADLPAGDPGLYPRVVGQLDGAGAKIDTTNTTVASIDGKVDAQGASLDAVVGDVADLHAKIDNDGVTLDAKLGPLQTYGSIGSKGISAGVEIVRTTTIDEAAATRTQVGVTADTLREQLTLSPTLEEGARWHLVNTVTGEARGLVGEQADLYIVTITAVGEDINQETVEGQPWFPRWGWLAPRVHGAFRQRQFHDLSPFAVTADGLLMDGLLVAALPSVEWSVDAWVLDRA